jgi:hypothetical protein
MVVARQHVSKVVRDKAAGQCVDLAAAGTLGLLDSCARRLRQCYAVL